MNSTQLGSNPRFWQSLLVLVACTMWCTVSMAQSSGHWHQRDHVTISGTPATSVTAGQSYSFTPSASDTLGRPLVFAVANMPAWATFNTSTGQLSGAPGAGSVGSYSNIVIAVSDGLKSANLPAFTVQVLASQTAPAPAPPPTISGNPATSDVAGNPYSFQPSASGPSGMTLAYSVQNKPTWASFSIATGLLSGTPSTTQTGTYGNIVLSVSDGQASSALPAFAITVTAPAPTTGSATVNLTPPTQNTDGSTITNLAGVTVYYGTSPSNLTQTVQVAGTAPTSYTVSGLATGTWYFAGAAYTTDGTQSAMSTVVSKAIQ
jgi:hypothetical protein